MNQPSEGQQPPRQYEAPQPPSLPQQPPSQPPLPPQPGTQVPPSPPAPPFVPGPHASAPDYRVAVPPPVPVTPIYPQPPSLEPQAPPGYAQPPYPPAPQQSAAPSWAAPQTAAPSWAAYARPIADIRDGHNAFLHERDWEGQLAAADRGPMPWGFLAFFLGLGVFYIGGLALTPLFSHAITDFDNTGDNHADGPLLIIEFLPNLAFALFPLWFSWWKGRGPKRDFGIAMRWRDLGIGLACGGVAIVIGILINIILSRVIFSGAAGSGDSGLGQLSDLSNGRTIWLALFALFAFIGAPITEELMFRGALWGALEGFKINRYVVLVLVTLVFAYGHQEPQATLALFCQGLAIGTARMITGRISSSMVAHATNNLIPALILFLAH